MNANSPKMIMSLKERLAEALIMRDMKPIDLSKATDISRGAISQYLAGKVRPKQDKIAKMAIALHVSPAWLMGLNVRIEPSPEGEDDSEVIDEYLEQRKIKHDYIREQFIRSKTSIDFEVSLNEREFLEEYRLLPGGLKRCIRQMVELCAYPELNKSTFFNQHTKAEVKEFIAQQNGLIVDEPDDSI